MKLKTYTRWDVPILMLLAFGLGFIGIITKNVLLIGGCMAVYLITLFAVEERRKHSV